MTQLLVFDSGIGGLGVVREIRRLQPEAGITYVADNAYFPYGEKPDDILVPHIIALLRHTIEILRPDALVIACNTASTIALAPLRETFALPIIGCVPPIKPAAAASKTRHIGILATAATIRRSYLQSLIDAHAPDCTIHSLGTPNLAALAEAKFRGQTVDIVPAIAPLFAQPGADKIDAIALGCTHYTFLLEEFLAHRPDITWLDPAAPVARRTLAVTAPLTTTATTNTALFTTDPNIPPTALTPFGFQTITHVVGWGAPAPHQ